MSFLKRMAAGIACSSQPKQKTLAQVKSTSASPSPSSFIIQRAQTNPAALSRSPG